MGQRSQEKQFQLFDNINGRAFHDVLAGNNFEFTLSIAESGCKLHKYGGRGC